MQKSTVSIGTKAQDFRCFLILLTKFMRNWTTFAITILLHTGMQNPALCRAVEYLLKLHITHRMLHHG
jgi:hypothetical protein